MLAAVPLLDTSRSSVRFAVMSLSDGRIVSALASWTSSSSFRRSIYRQAEKHNLKLVCRAGSGGTILLAGGLTRAEALGKLNVFVAYQENQNANAPAGHSSNLAEAASAGLFTHGNE